MTRKEERGGKKTAWKKEIMRRVDEMDAKVGKLTAGGMTEELSLAKQDLANMRFLLQNVQGQGQQLMQMQQQLQMAQMQMGQQSSILQRFLKEQEMQEEWKELQDTLAKEAEEAQKKAKEEAEASAEEAEGEKSTTETPENAPEETPAE